MASNWLSAPFFDCLVYIYFEIVLVIMDLGLMWPVENSAIFQGHWQSPYTALTAGKCLPLGLCKETVKESNTSGNPNLTSCSGYITICSFSTSFNFLAFKWCNIVSTTPGFMLTSDYSKSSDQFLLLWNQYFGNFDRKWVTSWCVCTEKISDLCVLFPKNGFKIDSRFLPDQLNFWQWTLLSDCGLK